MGAELRGGKLWCGLVEFIVVGWGRGLAYSLEIPSEQNVTEQNGIFCSQLAAIFNYERVQMTNKQMTN